MPKSRGRKRKPHQKQAHQKQAHRKQAQQSRSRPGGHPPRSAGELRAGALGGLGELVHATDLAEARGDALMALELIMRDLETGRDDHFWRPLRVQRLIQLVALRPMLPRWVTSRWVLDQAAQSLHEAIRPQARRAIDIAVETRGGERTLIGVNRLDARAKVVDHDWVHRQVFLYELGALQHFLARVATPDLLAGADHLHDWAGAAMGAFRFLEESSRTVTWLDLATGEQVTVPNLGCASLVLPDECAIGRLVPIDGGAMFDTAPLFVPDDVAHRVAEDPDDWVAAVAEACRRQAPPEQRVQTSPHDFRMLTDVPVDLQYATIEAFVEHVGESELGVDAGDLTAVSTAFVRAALEGELHGVDFIADPWPTVAATLLHPMVLLEVAMGVTAAEDAPKFRRLAEQLAAPADAVCRVLAGEQEQAG